MRHMQRWSPMGELWGLQDEMNRLFRGLCHKRGENDEEGGELVVWAPTVDICEDKEAVKITAELPGLEQKDVKVGVDEGVLTIKGERQFEGEKKEENYYRIERSYGSFSRAFTLPPTVESEKIKATMKNGELEVYLPKKEEAKPKEIEIEVS